MSLAARLEALLQRHWWTPRPTWLAALLWPLSRLYGGLAAQRRRQGLRARPAPLPVPLWVVGNWVVGGAGKTPTVLALVQALQAAGRRPGVVSRGYGATVGAGGTGAAATAVTAVTATSAADEVGDEPLLIHRRTGVPVWVGRQRVDVALALCQAHPQVDILISDDGLQHQALPRDAELVVFDERGAGNGLLLPAGPLREPLASRAPADVHRVLLYTAGLASTALPGALATRRLGPAWPLQAWWAGDAAAAVPLEQLRGQPLLAVAGLAAPEKFFAMLRKAQLNITTLPLPDHFAYTTLPWPASTTDIITTEKDAIKLQPGRLGSLRVWVVPLDLQLPVSMINHLLATLPPRPEPTLP